MLVKTISLSQGEGMGQVSRILWTEAAGWYIFKFEAYHASFEKVMLMLIRKIIKIRLSEVEIFSNSPPDPWYNS